MLKLPRHRDRMIGSFSIRDLSKTPNSIRDLVEMTLLKLQFFPKENQDQYGNRKDHHKNGVGVKDVW